MAYEEKPPLTGWLKVEVLSGQNVLTVTITELLGDGLDGGIGRFDLNQRFGDKSTVIIDADNPFSGEINDLKEVTVLIEGLVERGRIFPASGSGADDVAEVRADDQQEGLGGESGESEVSTRGRGVGVVIMEANAAGVLLEVLDLFVGKLDEFLIILSLLEDNLSLLVQDILGFEGQTAEALFEIRDDFGQATGGGGAAAKNDDEDDREGAASKDEAEDNEQSCYGIHSFPSFE